MFFSVAHLNLGIIYANIGKKQESEQVRISFFLIVGRFCMLSRLVSTECKPDLVLSLVGWYLQNVSQIFYLFVLFI